jgi:hypothetical protein
MGMLINGLEAICNLAAKTGERFFILGELLMFLGGTGLLVLVPYFGARAVLQWTQAALPTVVHGVVLLAFFVILWFWVWMISGDRGSRLFRLLYRQGIKWPFLFSIALLFFAVLCFASLSSMFNDLGRIRFEPAIPSGEFWRFQDFYMWHFLDSVPGLKIPETLRLNEPYKYKDPLSGVLLLFFKLIVIIPVIGSFTVWNRIRKEAKQEDKGATHGT